VLRINAGSLLLQCDGLLPALTGRSLCTARDRPSNVEVQIAAAYSFTTPNSGFIKKLDGCLGVIWLSHDFFYLQDNVMFSESLFRMLCFRFR
jgi:hypothetical protein